MPPKEAFIYLERKVNNEKCFAEVSETYKTKGPIKSFDLPFSLLSQSDLIGFELNADSRLIESLQKEKKIRFFVHPEMLRDYQIKNLTSLLDIKGSISVAPTSSTRTVLALEEKYPFMIKTDLERRIGDGIKKLKKTHLDHSKRIGQELETFSFSGFGYLSEPFGFLFSSGNQEVGLIIRDFYASPKLNSKNYLIPFFSLYSKDENSTEDPLLLLDLLKNLNKEDSNILDACLERIVAPYIGSWSNLILEKGLSMEMHAQNTLLEIDYLGKLIRIIYRDLQDTFVDFEIRDDKKLNCDFKRNVIGQNERTYLVEGIPVKDKLQCKQISYSLTYDYRMGRALDYLGRVLEIRDINAAKKLTSFVKDLWVKKFKDTEIFPKKAYILDNNQLEISRELNFREIEPKYR